MIAFFSFARTHIDTSATRSVIVNHGMGELCSARCTPCCSTGRRSAGIVICGRTSLWQHGEHRMTEAPARSSLSENHPARLIAERHGFGLLPEAGTHPSIYYLPDR